MPLHISVTSDFTLRQLAKLAGTHAIRRSPHVGNLTASNVTVAHALGPQGARLVLVDQGFGARDTTYHPNGIVAGGRFVPLTAPTAIMTHARVCEAVPPSWTGYFAPGQPVSAGHVATMRAAFPGVSITTATEHLAEQSELVRAVLAVVGPAAPQLWYRYVTTGGEVVTATADSWNTVQTGGIFGLDHPNHGWLIPNVVQILLDCVIDSLDYAGAKEVYHLSGPDMYRYAPKLEADISRLHDLLQTELPSLPPELTMHLVPTHCLIFTAFWDEDEEPLDRLGEIFARWEPSGAYWEQRLAGTTPGTAAYTAVERERRQATSGTLASKAQELLAGPLDWLLIPAKSQQHRTHHDLVIAQRAPAIPAWVWDARLEDLIGFVAWLTQQQHRCRRLAKAGAAS